MSDEIKTSNNNNDSADAVEVSNRRRLLKLGAASVPAIVSLQAGSALANTGMSISICSLDVTPAQLVQRGVVPDAVGLMDENFDAQRLSVLYDMNAIAVPDTNNPGGSLDPLYISYLDSLTSTDPGFSCLNSITVAVS